MKPLPTGQFWYDRPWCVFGGKHVQQAFEPLRPLHTLLVDQVGVWNTISYNDAYWKFKSVVLRKGVFSCLKSLNWPNLEKAKMECKHITEMSAVFIDEHLNNAVTGALSLFLSQFQ